MNLTVKVKKSEQKVFQVAQLTYCGGKKSFTEMDRAFDENL